MTARLPVFDLDGTLLDSDEALAAAFVALGVPRSEVTFGHVVDQECARLGISVDEYVACYDTDAARPFPGVAELLDRLERWALCSNKRPESARAELDRLGWRPEVALFADSFDGAKRLEPVLEQLGVTGTDVVYVGDTAHDRACAADVGAPFALAAWNPRAVAGPMDMVLREPAELLAVLDPAGLSPRRPPAG